MNTVAKIKLWGKQVGAVAWNDKTQIATFEFDKSFLRLGLNISPIKMPIEEIANARIFSFPKLEEETYKGLPGLLADCLPDRFGNKLLDAWFAKNGKGKTKLNPVERLCYIGKRGMGALEFEPVITSWKDESNILEIKELVQLSKDILNEKKKLASNLKTKAGLLNVIRVGTSAGGARAKAIIAFNKKTGEVRSGQIDTLDDFEYWIIKFDGVTNDLLGDPKGYGRIEYAYYLLAKAAGIEMMESILLEQSSYAHFMTKRFDRIANKKLHMQTLCALAHFDYNHAGEYSYEQAFEIMRELKLPYPQMEQFFKRMVFNVVFCNQDDHTKNISFLMNEEGEWKLSPAYDVTFAFDPKSKWMQAHQMSVNGKTRDINVKDLIEVSKNMNVKNGKKIIEEISKGKSKWNGIAKKAGIDLKTATFIKSKFLK